MTTTGVNEGSCCYAWHNSITAIDGYSAVVVRLPELRAEYTAIDNDGAAAVIQPGQSVIAGN